jgi:hypothetical protein
MEVVDWTDLAKGCCEHGGERSGSIPRAAEKLLASEESQLHSVS